MTMTQRYAGMLRRQAGEWDKQGMPVQAECARQAARHMDDLQAAIDLASRRLEQARATARWYCIDMQGMATLCAGEDDARREVERSRQSWPRSGPHRAVQLVDLAELLRAEPPDDRRNFEIQAMPT